MAVSDVQIAKLALSHLGNRWDITDLSEATTEAEQVNLYFTDVRDALLREHPWNFALRYTSPAQLAGTVPAQWTYMFTYPPDALRVWRIVNPLGRDLPPLKFEVLRNSDDFKVLVSDEQTPEFEYTKRVTSSAEFDSNFVMALSWRLAAHIAMGITGEQGIATRAQRQAEYYVTIAKNSDGNEGVEPEQTRDPDWIRNRV